MPYTQNPHTLLIADLKDGAENSFQLKLDRTSCAQIADHLELLALRKVLFRGTLTPQGKRGWRLKAKVGATVQQACIVTLNPVNTRLDETVILNYSADMDDQIAEVDIEMHQDTTQELLTREINLIEVLTEAISLALPTYPKSSKVIVGDASFTEPGKTPMSDEDAKPFAGLAALKTILARHN
jgi:uncharacterized metal-binding protein YceD (DUF177 family)